MAQATIGALRVVLGLDSAQFTNGLRRAQGQLKRTGKQWQSIGRQMSLAITAPIALIGTGILRAAGNFEAGMARMRAVLRPTGAEFDRLRDQAVELGRTTQFTATQVAGAMEVLAKNGLNATKIINGATEATLNFAAASGGDLAQAADVITDLMINFKLETSDLARVVDNATGALLTSKITFEDYVGAVGQAAGASGGLGVSLEDMNAALSLTASAFASGADAGTSFKGFLLRLVPTGEKGRKIIKKLGLEFFTAAGEMKNLAGIAETLKTSLKGLTTEAKIEALSGLFGQRTIRTALRLVEEGADGVRKRLEEIADVDAASVAADRLKSFEGALKLLKSALESLAIAISEAGLLKWVTDLAKSLTEMVRNLAETNPALLKWGTIIAGVAAVLGPLVIVAGLLITAIGALAPVAAALGATLAFLISPIGLAVAALGLLLINLEGLGEALGFAKKPTVDLMEATDALVKSMDTEIQRSADLNKVLKSSTSMSRQAAQVKLQEARARLTNAANAIVEQRIIAETSSRVIELRRAVKSLNNIVTSFDPLKGGVAATDQFSRKILADAKADLLGLKDELEDALEDDTRLTDWADRVAENFKIIHKAMEDAKGDVILFGDAVKDVDKKTGDLATATTDAEKETKRLEDVHADILAGLDDEIFQLELQRDLIGLTVEEAAKLFALEQALNDAKREGLKLGKTALENIKKQAAEIGKLAKEIEEKLERERNIEGIAGDIIDPLKDALKEGEINFRSFADTVVQIASRLRDRLIDELFDPIEDALIKMIRQAGGGGGVGSLFGGILGSLFGGGAGPATSAAGTSVTGTSFIPSFAHGADFTVGGSPGIDNNLIQFNATRGERVQVTPAGQSRGGGGNKVEVNIYAPPGSEVEESRQRVGDTEQINVFIDNAVAGNLSRPGTATFRAMQTTHGTNQQLVRR